MECTGLSLSRRSHLGLNRGSDARRRVNLVTRIRSSKSGALRTIAIPLAAALVFVVQMTAACVPRAGAASGLKLAPDLSFDDDSSPNFPIRGENLSDGSGASGEATVIFFGTSNCWNTSREAERLVKLYPQFSNRIHFVIGRLNNVAPSSRRWFLSTTMTASPRLKPSEASVRSHSSIWSAIVFGVPTNARPL